MTSRLGFFIFAGIVLGMIAAQVFFRAAGWGVIVGGVAGLIIGGGLDLRDWLREKQRGDG